jgi:pilus assembly protein CpaC
MVLTRRERVVGLALAILTCAVSVSVAAPPVVPPPGAVPPTIEKIELPNTKVEMTVNTNRILMMDGPIPTAQVANPDLIDFTVLSENQVQLHAKKSGITTVTLWDEKNETHVVDVVVSGDVKELDLLLRRQFPTASIKLYPTAASTLIISGYSDRPDYINRIMQIAQDYFPKVINNMTVGGSQQVLLHVQVMQVSRTKLRNLGVDLMGFSGANYGGTTVSGLITKANPTTTLLRTAGAFTTNGAETMQFGLISGPNGMVGMIEALKQDDILKVLAEPTLATVSGRPASCLVGGKVAYPQPTGFGNISVAFQNFGTQIDFVPIVLGNGGCRLEVRPAVSEIDYTLGTTINGTSVPGFRVRQADTGVELKFSQTLAIAGLLSQDIEQQVKGIPGLMDVPYFGALFRRTHSKVNEVELLILVRPELVEGLDPDQVPPCRPGMTSLSPDDCDLYWKGYREVPAKPYPQGGPAMMGPGGLGPIAPGPTPVIQEQPAPPAPGDPSARAGQRPTVADARGGSVAPPAVRRVPTPVAQARPESYDRANRQDPNKGTPTPAKPSSTPPGFIGPTGYDVRN